jgi:hypothetical protein
VDEFSQLKKKRLELKIAASITAENGVEGDQKTRRMFSGIRSINAVLMNVGRGKGQLQNPDMGEHGSMAKAITPIE